ncbi:hypothetical protein [uncultured Ruegeria sp.]|uniref:hypothetical protein n=1 Tax=uncultured Ruegeria sp. TaxID=259304 RepID=UPI00260AB123|nr:hypothetical protein [uncultured Ruegeria sp.]
MKLNLWGAIGSFFWCCIIFAAIVTNPSAFISLSPNNWGDFLAGVFGPLALFWLVLGFLQQGKELQNSVDALNLQAKELAHSVEQQKELVRVTRETLEHEREVLNIRAITEKESLQPKLDIKFGAKSRNGLDNYRYFTKITNIGHTVANFSIEFILEGQNFLQVSNELLRFEDAAENQAVELCGPITEGLSAIVRFDDREGDQFLSKYDVVFIETESNWPRYTIKRISHEKVGPT